MRRAFDLLKLLADGTEHAGEDLAAELGVTRAAVWNHVSRLRAEGGYNRIETIEVTDSTNERLLQEQAAGDVHGRVLFAEYQNAGRGRRGDRWMSPPGSGLCFSLAWRFDAPPTTFSALSLVVGVALVESLQPLGVRDALLKWPNDIVRGAGKMAGILIEMRSELSGPSTTVIGVGLNVSLSTHARELIDRPSDDFLSAGGSPLSRNVLAASLLAGLATALDTFAREGFAPFRDRWHALDALAARKVTLELGPRTVVGVARGVDEHGALIIIGAHATGRYWKFADQERIGRGRQLVNLANHCDTLRRPF